MKRAAIIFGPSNSGTRYLTSLFLQNSWWGEVADYRNSYTQKLDDGYWPDAQECIVWKTHNPGHLNLPSDQHYGNTNLLSIVEQCENKGYKPFILMSYRDIRLNSKAKVKAGYHIDQKFLYEYLINWYKEGFAVINDLILKDYQAMVINYDLMIKHPKLYTNEISNQFNTKLAPIETTDANSKHWDLI